MTTKFRATDTLKTAAPSFLMSMPVDHHAVAGAVLLAMLCSTSVAAPAPFRAYQDTANKHASFAVDGLDAGIADRQHPMLKRIALLSTYQAEWNGAGSIGPTIGAVSDAMRFAGFLLSTDNVADPYITLADDGEINFYWKLNSLVMDLGVTGNGRYSFFAQTPDGREFIEDGAQIDEPLPPDLLAAMCA